VELNVSICPPSSGQNRSPYSPPSAIVKVESAPTKKPEKVLRFVVKDYGKGIASKDFEKIFEPFLQDSAETENVYGGSGLGLAITTKLVHRLGGSVSVDSEVGRWSEFTVDLPFYDDPDSANLDEMSAGLNDTTIFIVCDDVETKELAVTIFRHYNADFESFLNMKELESRLLKPGVDLSAGRQSYICLVHEDLYDQKCYEILSSASLRRSALLTLGPRFTVKEAQGHYRSLEHMLPSEFMKSLGVHVTKALKSERSFRKDLLEEQRIVNSVVAVPYSDLRVLIAEDNMVNQKVLKRILNRLGIQQVEIVDNGQKAVDREAAQEFDIVLMDMQMPVMDGIVACRQICNRKGGQHPKAKVVFVTAHAMDTFETECFKAGAIEFLTKPCNLSTVDKCFERVFEKATTSATDSDLSQI
jgi:two-component system sensor histidine kinase/response regulator